MNTIISKAALIFLACFGTAQGQPTPPVPAGYPTKPIRVVVTSAAGGGLEIVTRTVMERVGQRLGKPVIIDVQAGGTGVIGTQIVASSTADGYTVLGTGDSLIINGVLKKLPFDVRLVLTPVQRTTIQYYMYFVHSSVPVNNVRELLAYAKANPGKLNFASSGTGGAAHLGMELIKHSAGIDITHVPYKGNGPAMTDFAAGRIQMIFGGLSTMHLVKSGQARLIGALSPKRLEQFPDTPTVAESGLPGFELSNTYAVYAPIKTPAGIVALLNREIGQVVNSPDLRQRFSADFIEGAPPQSADELRRMMSAEYDKWENVVKLANIKGDVL